MLFSREDQAASTNRERPIRLTDCQQIRRSSECVAAVCSAAYLPCLAVLPAISVCALAAATVRAQVLESAAATTRNSA